MKFPLARRERFRHKVDHRDVKRRLAVVPLLAACVACFAASAHAGMITITDGDFSSFNFGATGTATVTREPTGGNPGARLNVTTVSGPTVWGTAIKTDFVTTAVLSGSAFNLKLDVLSGSGAFGAGQGISLLVEQNGSIYGNHLGSTGFPLNFDTVSFDGTFNSAGFLLLIGSGPASPDFDGGVATRFGFAAGNSGSGTLTQYYDNFRLETSATDVAPVPEPSSAVLLGLGGALVWWRRRRMNSERNSKPDPVA